MAIRSPRPRRWREMRHFLAMRARGSQQGLAFSHLFCRGNYGCPRIFQARLPTVSAHCNSPLASPMGKATQPLVGPGIEPRAEAHACTCYFSTPLLPVPRTFFPHANASCNSLLASPMGEATLPLARPGIKPGAGAREEAAVDAGAAPRRRCARAAGLSPQGAAVWRHG